VRLRTWTGAAGTNEWDCAENWHDRIIPSDGEGISIAVVDSEMALTPAAPAGFNAADLYVTGNIGGGPIVVNGEFHWKAGRIAADLKLKVDGNVITGESLELSGTIKSAGSLAFEGGDQILLNGGQVLCANNVTFTNCGLRSIPGAPSRFTSKNFCIKGSGRFSGKDLTVERASGGLFYIDGELDVDEGVKLILNRGTVGGWGFLNLIYDATMEVEQSDSTGAGCGWFNMIPAQGTTAKIQFIGSEEHNPVNLL
jgi:hypothetical protein